MILRQKTDDHYTTHTVYDIMVSSTGMRPSLEIEVADVEIADDPMILDLWLKHSTWFYSQIDLNHYVHHDEGTGTDTEIPGGWIFTDWQFYLARNGENLLRMLQALFAEYDPLANYDMQESGSDGEAEDKTHNTPKGKTHTDITPYATGINSTGNGAQQGKQMTETYFSDSAEAELSHDHNKSITDNDGSSVSGFWKTHAHYFKRHGNIGVTSSAQLISGELELRVVDLIESFVQRFFDRYCWYVGGDR